MLLKTIVYIKRYDGETNWMYFLIECDELWEKFNVFKFNQYSKRTLLGPHLD